MVDPANSERDTDRAARPPASGTRLVRDRVSREVEDFIARRIFSGTLAGGDRIDLDAIAAELGVSRIPVREALTALEREGLVSTEFYRGFRVSHLDAAVIHESFELYGLLASLAVRQVTEAADQAELGRLAAVGDAALVNPVSNADFSRLSYAYRRELHKAGGSQRLRRLLAGFRASLSAAGHVIDPAGIAAVQETLRAEVRALRTGDPDLAARNLPDPATQRPGGREHAGRTGCHQRGRVTGRSGRCLLAGRGKLTKIAMN